MYRPYHDSFNCLTFDLAVFVPDALDGEIDPSCSSGLTLGDVPSSRKTRGDQNMLRKVLETQNNVDDPTLVRLAPCLAM